ncbi:MAG: hypothetical protein M1825_003063 [Sarcosagium campestre]|nr:MAG: hypothetical protein M1825_003063 [Sarcosagium campestre]
MFFVPSLLLALLFVQFQHLSYAYRLPLARRADSPSGAAKPVLRNVRIDAVNNDQLWQSALGMCRGRLDALSMHRLEKSLGRGLDDQQFKNYKLKRRFIAMPNSHLDANAKGSRVLRQLSTSSAYALQYWTCVTPKEGVDSQEARAPPYTRAVLMVAQRTEGAPRTIESPTSPTADVPSADRNRKSIVRLDYPLGQRRPLQYAQQLTSFFNLDGNSPSQDVSLSFFTKPNAPDLSPESRVYILLYERPPIGTAGQPKPTGQSSDGSIADSSGSEPASPISIEDEKLSGATPPYLTNPRPSDWVPEIPYRGAVFDTPPPRMPKQLWSPFDESTGQSPNYDPSDSDSDSDDDMPRPPVSAFMWPPTSNEGDGAERYADLPFALGPDDQAGGGADANDGSGGSGGGAKLGPALSQLPSPPRSQTPAPGREINAADNPWSNPVSGQDNSDVPERPEGPNPFADAA